MRKVIVGHSGGVTSARCLAWALEEYPREEVIALWHNTQNEDPDTVRFLFEIAAKLNIEVTEQSDGRSVEEVEIDEGALANNRMAFCSRILKADQRDIYIKKLREEGFDEIINIIGFSNKEWQRIQRALMRAIQDGYIVRFPIAIMDLTKQQCVDWCISLGVRPPRMYEWSDHANCINCRRGGKTYIQASAVAHPEIFEQLKIHESNPVFQGHTIFPEGPLQQIIDTKLKRKVNRKESIEIGPCECGT